MKDGSAAVDCWDMEGRLDEIAMAVGTALLLIDATHFEVSGLPILEQIHRSLLA
jgi:hypothetical protein